MPNDNMQQGMSAEESKFFRDLRTDLAALAHDQWSGWMAYLLETCVRNDDGSISFVPERVAAWKRQMTTAYQGLSQQERDQDGEEADRVIAVVRTHLSRLESELAEEAAEQLRASVAVLDQSTPNNTVPRESMESDTP